MKKIYKMKESIYTSATERTRNTNTGTASPSRYTGTSVSLYAQGEAVAVSYTSSGTNRGGVSYLGKDILGSVKASYDSYGVLEERYEYDAFGTPYKGDLTGGMNYGYTGKPFDATTGMYNYGYRDYQPSVARFTTVDPVRDGSNWFAYVANDPVNWVDPDGLMPTKEDHYGRNKYNTDVPKTEMEAINDGWTKLSEWQDGYHENGTSIISDPAKNNKYVSEDGHQEGVYDENGNLVTDPVNEGTYNFNDPKTDWFGHIVNDMLPYYMWGNSEDDPTSIFERITSSYKGDVNNDKGCGK